MLQVIFEEELEDDVALARSRAGSTDCGGLSAPYPPEETAARTGIAPDEAASSPGISPPPARAAVYGRTGSCLGRHGTLVSFLLDALNVVTGNLDRRGRRDLRHRADRPGEILHRIGAATYDRYRSRIGGLPEVLGSLPATLMAKEITTPGRGQMKAFFVSSGNPVLSVPNGDELEEAFKQLELMVAIDLYVTDTTRHADYILPGTTFLEREDFPSAFLTFHTSQFVQWAEPVVKPRGEARQEWQIIEAISRRIGVTPSSAAPARWLGKLGIRFSPQYLIDLLIRTGPKGTCSGCVAAGSASRSSSAIRTGSCSQNASRSGYCARRFSIATNASGSIRRRSSREVAALATENGHDPAFPLRLIGLGSCARTTRGCTTCRS